MTIALLIGALFHISGAQFNPAVSITVALLGRQSWPAAACSSLPNVLEPRCRAMLFWLIGDVWTLPKTAGGVEHVADRGALQRSQRCNGSRQCVPRGASGGHRGVLPDVAIMGVIIDRRSGVDNPILMGIPIGMVVAVDVLCFGPLTAHR